MTQNATPSNEAAMSDRYVFEQSGEAPDEGHPIQKAERVYAGKYKSPDDLEKGYTELSSKLGKDAEERKRLEDDLNRTRSELSLAQLARQQYESAMRERSGSAQPDTKVYDQFKKHVNPDDEVLGAVSSLSEHVASQVLQKKLDPELTRVKNDLRQFKVNAFNASLDQFKKSNPEFAKLLPEIRDEAAKELDLLYSMMIQNGSPQEVAMEIVDNLNHDVGYAQRVFNRVRGGKGKDYWAEVFKPVVQETEDAKKHLGGGGSSPEAGSDLGDKEFEALSPSEQRKILVKRGILKA